MTGSITSAELDDLLRAERPRPLVFVTVGSDHHRFDRLIEWLDAWLDERSADVDCIVQHGTAAQPRNARGIDYVDHDLLQRCMSGAAIVLVQGGPMSIIEARRNGTRPIVVPRIARLDEVVDDHQVTFCRKLAAQQLITLAEDEDTLHAALDAALRDPATNAIAPETSDAASAEAVERIRRSAELIVAQRRHREPPTVVLLGGAGRSGSTLLERLLAEAPAVAALGETIHLWERGLDADELCGCGESFSACPFWNKVGEDAFGGWDRVDVQDVIGLRHAVVRSRYTVGLLGVSPKPSWRLKRDRLTRMLARLHQSAASVADVRVLIDSSKHPAYAMLLRRTAVDLRCVLVVRDPRAVAYSWQRAVRRPEVTDRDVEMPTYGLVRSALTWSLYALLYQLLPTLGVPVTVVRYEDLMTDPSRVVQEVLRFAGAPAADGDASELSTGAIDLGVAHTVAGNPMRFQVGPVELRSDEEWRTGLSRGRKTLVSVLTTPTRWLYGYR
ncbi:MAG: sulfotransferase [Nocardioidaceae bacterium]